LNSALDGGEWSVSRPGRFTPRERASGTHWIGGWVGPRAVLDTGVKRKIPSHHTFIIKNSKNGFLSNFVNLILSTEHYEEYKAVLKCLLACILKILLKRKAVI
jgi:hypothetical protein